MRNGCTRELGRAASLFLVVVAASVAGAAAPAAADDQALDELVALSLDDLMQVEVITAGRKEQSWLETAAAVHVITRGDIRRSGARSLPDLLRLVPGMHVARINSHTWAVSVRGFADAYSDKLLVMIDGRSIYTPLFSGVHWNQHDLLLEDIERIEVVRGPGASVWGVNAVNGVINIITRESAETTGTLVQAGVGDEDQVAAAIRHGGRMGSRGHHRVWAKHVERDALALASGEEAPDEWSTTTAGFRLDWSAGGTDFFSLSGGLHRSHWNELRSDLAMVPPHERKVEASGSHETWDLSFRWRRELSRRSSLRVHAWFDGTERDRPNLGEKRRGVSLELQQETRFGERYDLTWGVGYRRTSDRMRESFEVAFSERDHVFEIVHGFVQAELGLSERLRLTLGTKLDTDRHRGLDAQPTLRLAWRPREDLLVWASLSRALRVPNRVDYHAILTTAVDPDPAGGPPMVQRVYGRHDQEPESLLAWEAGLRWQLRQNLTLELAGFRNDYEDLRSMEPGEPRLVQNEGPIFVETPRFLEGLASARARGGELALGWLPHRRWKLALAWSYLDLGFSLDPSSNDLLTVTGAGRGHSPRHRLHLSSRIDLPRGWELDLELDRPLGWNGLDVPEKTRVDLRLAWRPSERFDCSISGQDLLSDGHLEFGDEPYLTTVAAVERSIHASATWRF